jgi:hypothetical protein
MGWLSAIGLICRIAIGLWSVWLMLLAYRIVGKPAGQDPSYDASIAYWSGTYKVLAQQHAAEEAYLSVPCQVSAEPLINGGVWTQDDALRHYWALRLKYERAARYPWRSVEPDPPLPAIVPPL